MATITKPSFLATNTRYYSVSSTTEGNDYESEEHTLDPKLELGEHPQVSTNRSWPMTIGLQFLSLLWLVPILTFLILNLKGHILGASACEYCTYITIILILINAGIRVSSWSLLDSSL